MRNNPSIYSLKSRLNRGYLKSRNARLLFFVGQTLCIIDIGTSEVGKRCVSHAVVAWVSVIYFLKGRVYCMAIKSFTVYNLYLLTCAKYKKYKFTKKYKDKWEYWDYNKNVLSANT